MTDLSRIKTLLKKKILTSPAKIPINFLQHRLLKDTDLFIASYPKSGSTWLRFWVYQLICCSDTSFSSVNAMIPIVGKHFFLKEYGSDAFKRIIKTHESFRSEYSQAIYIVRDPRDVLISEYYYQRMTKMIADNADFDNFLYLFISKGVNRFGTWQKNVATWHKQSQVNDRIHIIKFEDMKLQPFKTLKSIAKFLQINTKNNELNNIIANNSLENMKAKEKTGRDKTFRGARKDISFVRNGKAGGWRNILTSVQSHRIYDIFAKEIEMFNYN